MDNIVHGCCQFAAAWCLTSSTQTLVVLKVIYISFLSVYLIEVTKLP